MEVAAVIPTTSQPLAQFNFNSPTIAFVAIATLNFCVFSLGHKFKRMCSSKMLKFRISALKRP